MLEWKLLMVAAMKNLIKLTIVSLLLATVFCLPAMAQLSDDPTTQPFPEFGVTDPQRAVVVKVQFNAATEVVLQDIIVANTRARMSLGAPALLVLEMLDQTGKVIATQNAWHPLWVRQWDEGGNTESGSVAASGPGTFYVPLSETLRAIRITDTELAQVLITVDVSAEVLAYCESTPNTPICALFLSGFE